MREIIDQFFEWSVHSYWGGVLWMIMGILGIIWSYKDMKKPEEVKEGHLYYLGWGGAIGMVITGILIIIGNLLGKL